MTTLLCDGNNLLYRSIHAASARGVDLSGDGTDTGPLLIFANMLSKYSRQFSDGIEACVIVAWDSPCQWRRQICDDYKGDRVSKASDPTLTGHFELAYEFLEALGVWQLSAHNFEADDIIAELVRLRDDYQVILSADKDMLQLVGRTTHQMRPGDDKLWNIARVVTDMGCFPWHLPMVMAMAGDKIDGIEGLPGVGYKTACKLLSSHDWDLGVLLDDPSVKKVYGSAELIRRNLKLIDLRQPPVRPVLRDIASTRERPTAMAQLSAKAFTDRFGLASIAARLEAGTFWYAPPSGLGRRLQ